MADIEELNRNAEAAQRGPGAAPAAQPAQMMATAGAGLSAGGLQRKLAGRLARRGASAAPAHEKDEGEADTGATAKQAAPGEAGDDRCGAIPKDPEAAARAHFDRATRLFVVDRYLEAAKEFGEAYVAVGNPDFLFNMARSYERAGQKPQAIEFYEKYLRFRPDAQDAGKVKAIITQIKKHLGAVEEIPPITKAPEVEPPPAATKEAEPPPSAPPEKKREPQAETTAKKPTEAAHGEKGKAEGKGADSEKAIEQLMQEAKGSWQSLLALHETGLEVKVASTAELSMRAAETIDHYRAKQRLHIAAFQRSKAKIDALQPEQHPEHAELIRLAKRDAQVQALMIDELKRALPAQAAVTIDRPNKAAIMTIVDLDAPEVAVQAITAQGIAAMERLKDK